MDVMTVLEPSLRVSLFLGLTTFDKNLDRSAKIRVISWLILLFNLHVQFSNFYYYMRIDFEGDFNELINKRPHDSTIIALNCFLTPFIILLFDGMIHKTLGKLKVLNKTKFPLDENKLRRVRHISQLLNSACVVFCVAFFGINTLWCWYSNTSENLKDYILYCAGIFLRYNTYGNLSNQLVSYYMLMWLWYHTINERMKRLKDLACKKRQKMEMRVLMEADLLIKDLNEDVSFVYGIFILLSCAAALIGCVHSAVFLLYIQNFQTYEAVLSLFFAASVIAQTALFAGICGSITKEIQQSAYQVQDLFLDNVELKEEVQIFSLQFLHRGLKFTACGLFTLDLSLLYKMAGTAMTYIIIVVQLQGVTTPKSTCSGANCTDA